MQFELKDNKKFVLVPGTPQLITNENMTKAKALKFLVDNTEYRKTLFSKLPKNVDKLIEDKKNKSE